VIHPVWLEGPENDLPNGEITYLIEKTSLYIYLSLLRAQHHMQQAIREGAVENDQWDYELFPLFYVILDGYIATISVFSFTSYPYTTVPLSQVTIDYLISLPLSL
jgi:hypothetical protein